MILPVPHYMQEEETSCYPASCRMVLSFIGIEQSEAALRRILRIEERGTPIDNIDYLESEENLKVIKDNLTLGELKQYLDQGVPVIVSLWTEYLPYWNKNSAHAVVVVGYEEDGLWVNDPKHPDAPKKIMEKAFMEAWDLFEYFGVVILTLVN